LLLFFRKEDASSSDRLPVDEHLMTVGETGRAHLWQAARTLGACALSTEAAALAGLKEPYWALITAVIVTQPMLDDTISAARTRVAGTLIGAAAGCLVLAGVQHGMNRPVLFWCAMVPLAWLTALRQSFRLSCITLAIVVLIPSQGPVFERPMDRVFGILLGAAASVIITAVVRDRGGKRRANATGKAATD
jgi:uncharacterized membrane protein YccC